MDTRIVSPWLRTSLKELSMDMGKFNRNTLCAIQAEGNVVELSLDEVKRRIKRVYGDSEQWEYRIDRSLPEEKALTVHSLYAYLLNRFRGYGHCNDETLHVSDLADDPDGELLREAELGLFLSKKTWIVWALYPMLCPHSMENEKRKKLKLKDIVSLKWPLVLDTTWEQT